MTDIPSPPSSGKTGVSLDLPILVSIPAGRFWLGASPDDSQALEVEKPGREIYLNEFKIGRYPVTNKQYVQFVKEASRPGPPHWVDGEIPAGIDTQFGCNDSWRINGSDRIAEIHPREIQ
jgi:formylglycine-generating enzyme required for sulfatase activity